MPFLNPNLFAVGLASVAIPIAIHILMRRRRKPIAWAAMRFLMEAYRQQRRRTRLEQLLLLAARCLLVAALAVAIGRPAFKSAGYFDTAGPRTMVLIIDNSLTSGVAGPGGATDLDASKARAETLLKTLSATRGDSASVIATAGPASAMISPPSSDLAAVVEVVRRMTPAASGQDLVGAIGAAREAAAAGSGSPSVVFLSGWRSADTAKPLPALDSGENLRVAASAPADRPVSNVTVMDAAPVRSILIAPETQTGTAQSQVRLSFRRGGELPAATTPVEVRAVALSGELSPPAVGQVRWTAGQTSAAAAVTVEIPVTMIRQGPALAIAASVTGDALAGDNVFIRPVLARKQVRVALLSTRTVSASDRPDQFSSADWIGLALAPSVNALDRRGAEIDVVVIDPASAGAATEVLAADAVFVAAPDRLDEPVIQSLRRMLDAGKLLVLMPAAGDAVAAWADTLTTGLDLPWTIAAEPVVMTPEAAVAAPATGDSGLFAMLGAELGELVKPVRVGRILPVTLRGDGARTLLALPDGKPLLVSTTSGARGLAVYLASAPELSWTNLPAMPLMLPVMQEILRQGIGESAGTSVAIAGRPTVWPKSAQQFRRLEVPTVKAGEEPAPPAPVRTSGLFRTVDAAGRTIGLFAVNPEPDAGKVELATPADIQRWLAPLAGPGRFAWLDQAAPAPTAEGASAAVGEDQGTPFDLTLLLIAAGLAVVEMVLARRFSHASVQGRSPGLSAGLPAGAAAASIASGAEVAS